MEINPDHDVIRGLKTLLEEKDEDRARDLSELLFDTSLLTSGFQVMIMTMHALVIMQSPLRRPHCSLLAI